jgi:poly-gamma-glutamate synthesis protein (capsule biosynthesis protein)
MHAEIARLRAKGYLPIATFQHFEYYTYAALPNQIADFGGMAEAGAAIVSGSQAHHPQAIAFQDGAFIHYGLGNLFFDQLDVGPGTRLAFIDRHVLYDGRYISTELLTIVFEDYARARPMNAAEREALLRSTFAASGW